MSKWIRRYPLYYTVISVGLLWFCLAGFANGVTVVSVANGNWSDQRVWNPGIPQKGDDVIIKSGHVIRYDLSASPSIHSVLVSGKLIFVENLNTILEVGMLVVHPDENYNVKNACKQHGQHSHDPNNFPELVVGSIDKPIQSNASATVRLKYFKGDDTNCAPGIIAHSGKMDFHGTKITPTWIKLGATAPQSTNTIQLAEPVNWKVGDQIIVVATGKQKRGGRPLGSAFISGKRHAQTEEFTIESVSKNRRIIGLSGRLLYDHLGGANADDLRGEAANLSRNVIVESADPDGERGHTMYHENAYGSISYSAFRSLGKRGVLARYPIHFHLVKDKMRGSFVEGAVIFDSHSRWITIHGTEYMVIRDTIGYKSLGHGYFFEDGSEVFNLFENNLGVQAYMTDPLPRQALAYDRNNGGCYWAANARNFIYNSTFVECDNLDSFILEYEPGDRPMMIPVLMPSGKRRVVDVSALSGGRIKGLEVHTHYGWGPWIKGGYFPENNPLLFEDTKVWNVHYSLDISASNVVFDGVKMYNSSYGFYNLYPGPHVVRNAYCEGRSFEHGCFMTYRGGHGTMIYENIVAKTASLVFRMTASNQQGLKYKPIEIHTRNVKILNPEYKFGSNGKSNWIGTESDNVRSNPLLMTVMHDMFGKDKDAVVLPAKQPDDAIGVPSGLEFKDGASVRDENGIAFQGRGKMKVALGNVPFPNSPLLRKPKDKIPPATSILFPPKDTEVSLDKGKLDVSGVSLDQHKIVSVKVNGQAAHIQPNGFDWQVTLSGLNPGDLKLTAVAVDEYGNTEVYPHTIHVTAAN